MSLDLVDSLSAATAQLRAAMQKADLSDIEKAMAQFRDSIEAIEAVGAWRSNPQLKARVQSVMAELESARMLACLLGDMTGQMHAAYAARNMDAPQPLYGPR
jgi:aminopeptidase N